MSEMQDESARQRSRPPYRLRDKGVNGIQSTGAESIVSSRRHISPPPSSSSTSRRVSVHGEASPRRSMPSRRTSLQAPAQYQTSGSSVVSGRNGLPMTRRAPSSPSHGVEKTAMHVPVCFSGDLPSSSTSRRVSVHGEASPRHSMPSRRASLQAPTYQNSASVSGRSGSPIIQRASSSSSLQHGVEPTAMPVTRCFSADPPYSMPLTSRRVSVHGEDSPRHSIPTRRVSLQVPTVAYQDFVPVYQTSGLPMIRRASSGPSQHSVEPTAVPVTRCSSAGDKNRLSTRPSVTTLDTQPRHAPPRRVTLQDPTYQDSATNLKDSSSRHGSTPPRASSASTTSRESQGSPPPATRPQNASSSGARYFADLVRRRQLQLKADASAPINIHAPPQLLRSLPVSVTLSGSIKRSTPCILTSLGFFGMMTIWYIIMRLGS